MASDSKYEKYSLALLVLFFVSSNLFNGIHGSQNQLNKSGTKLIVISHKPCKSCPGPLKVASLENSHTYSELKNDPQASLPSSFTICVSVLVKSLNPLFTLLGNDGQPWFRLKLRRLANLVDDYLTTA